MVNDKVHNVKELMLINSKIMVKNETGGIELTGSPV